MGLMFALKSIAVMIVLAKFISILTLIFSYARVFLTKYISIHQEYRYVIKPYLRCVDFNILQLWIDFQFAVVAYVDASRMNFVPESFRHTVEEGDWMRLTTKGRYGMRLVLDIAQHGSERPVSMSEVSLRQDISLKYLERLVGELQRAGIVKSLRGRVGGHVLALPPQRITVGDVVRALEGESPDLPCGNNRLACPRSVHCLTRAIWVAADQAMFEKLDSVTVQDILEDGQNCMARKEASKLAQIKAAQVQPQEQQKRRKSIPSRVFLYSAVQQAGENQARDGEGVKTILAVDDNPDIVEYLVTIFRERGYAAYGATSGEEAMDTLLRIKPDLITLDLEMPEEWGPKFHQRYSKMPQFKDIPVVVISGLPGIHRAISKAVATLSKPFEPEDVLTIVESAIGPPCVG